MENTAVTVETYNLDEKVRDDSTARPALQVPPTYESVQASSASDAGYMDLCCIDKLFMIWNKLFLSINSMKQIPTYCLVSLVVLSVTATLEAMGSIPRSSKKCYWIFLRNSL